MRKLFIFMTIAILAVSASPVRGNHSSSFRQEYGAANIRMKPQPRNFGQLSGKSLETGTRWQGGMNSNS
jgi:hypothetical protein